MMKKIFAFVLSALLALGGFVAAEEKPITDSLENTTKEMCIRDRLCGWIPTTGNMQNLSHVFPCRTEIIGLPVWAVWAAIPPATAA